MNSVVGELAPVFLLITLGWAVRAARIATPEAFGAVNRFAYFVLYPAFLFILSANADLSGPDSAPFVIGVLLGFVVMVALALAMRLIFRGDGPAYTSVFQGSVRWNGFVLLSAAPMLYGPAGPAIDRPRLRAAGAFRQCRVRRSAGALGDGAGSEHARASGSNHRQPAYPGLPRGPRSARGGPARTRPCHQRAGTCWPTPRCRLRSSVSALASTSKRCAPRAFKSPPPVS
ncbi:MAG: hypothetical protein WDM79_09130 [Terricaulis sp.]